MRKSRGGARGLAALAAVLATVLVVPSLARAAPAPTYAVVGAIKASAERWDYSSYDPVRRRLYVAAGRRVMAIDLANGTVHPAFARGLKFHSAFALPGGATVVTTDGDASLARLIDAASGAVLAAIPTGTKPDAAIFDPASGLVLVMNGRSGDVTLIDPAARKAVGRIVVGGALEFAAADGAGRALVNVENRDQIAVIDIKARRVVARHPLNGCKGPTGLAYDKADDLIVSACANHVAEVVRGASGKIVATLAIGADPDAVLFDPRRSLAFIPCGGDGVLDVIALGGARGGTIVQRLRTQMGARSGDLDPASGRLYLPAARYGPAKPGQDAPMVSGSFEILVVAPR